MKHIYIYNAIYKELHSYDTVKRVSFTMKLFFFPLLSCRVNIWIWVWKCWKKFPKTPMSLSENSKNLTNLWLVVYFICTLTGNFIRYTLLVPGWTPFASRTALILCGIDSTRFWKHSSEILVHIDMIASRSCCRFVGCTSMMWISRSTTSQSCTIGLRSGDYGGHLSKVNSLSCSRTQCEMIWALWHAALSFWK